MQRSAVPCRALQQGPYIWWAHTLRWHELGTSGIQLRGCIMLLALHSMQARQQEAAGGAHLGL